MNIQTGRYEETDALRLSNKPVPFKEGDILSATILSKDSESALIKFENGSMMQVPATLEGEAGEQVQLEVKKAASMQYVFKQISKDTVKADGGNDELIRVDADPITLALEGRAFAFGKAVLSKNYDITLKLVEAVNKIKKQLVNCAKNINPNQIESLLESGLSLDKISVKMLDDTLKNFFEPKSYSVSNADVIKSIESATGLLEKENSEMSELLKRAEILLKNNAPVNEENIELLKNVESKLSALKLDDAAIAHLLANDEAITLNAATKAMFANKELKPENDVLFKQLLPSIESLCRRENIEMNESLLNTAKLLISNDLPLTKDSIDTYNALKMGLFDVDAVLNSAAEKIRAGQGALEAELFPANLRESTKTVNELLTSYTKIAEDIPKIDTQTIQNVLKSGMPLNIKNLQLSILQQQSGDVAQQNNIVEPYTNIEVKQGADYIAAQRNVVDSQTNANQQPPVDNKVMAAKKTLLEISMKLTAEATLRLATKGIEIDMLPLSKALEKLAAEERQVYKSNLQAVGAQPTESNAKIVQDTVAKIKAIAPHASTVASIIKRDIDFTVDEVYKSDTAAKVYLATSVDAKYGYSIDKLDDEIESLLQKQSMDYSPENKKAARALIQLDMDITEESISKAKLIDEKVKFVCEKLHPMVVASMVRDGKYPLGMKIDEVIDYMNSFEEQTGKTTKEKIIEHIYDMDKKNLFEEDERELVMSIYRKLHRIDKTDGFASGYVASNKMESTFENLLSAAKFYETTIAKPVKSLAKDIIDEAAPSSEDEELIESNKQLLDIMFSRIADVANPRAISEFAKRYPGVDKMTLERIYRELKSISAELQDEQALQDNERVLDFVDNLKKIADISGELPKWLMSKGINVTPNNLFQLSNLVKDSSWLGKKIDDFEKALKNNKLTSVPSVELEKLKTDGVQSVLDEIEKEIDDKIVEQNSDISMLVALGSVAKSVMSLQKAAAGDSFFQAPVRINGEVTNLNFLIANEKLDSSTTNVFMSLQTKNLGDIQAFITLSGDEVAFTVSAETSHSLTKLERAREHLAQQLEDNGLVLKGIDFRLTAENEKQFNAMSEIVLANEKHIQSKFNVTG